MTSASSVVTTSGPIGMLPSKFLPAVHWVAGPLPVPRGGVVEDHEPGDRVERLVRPVMYRPPAPMTMPSSPS